LPSTVDHFALVSRARFLGVIYAMAVSQAHKRWLQARRSRDPVAIADSHRANARMADDRAAFLAALDELPAAVGERLLDEVEVRLMTRLQGIGARPQPLRDIQREKDACARRTIGGSAGPNGRPGSPAASIAVE
jgi:hypothetical protein